MSRKALAYRIEQHRMRRLWRGVYLVGPGKPDPLSLAMGAVLTTGGDGVLSHGSGGWLLGYIPTFALPIDVTVSGSSKRPRPRIRMHRSTTLDPRDVTSRRGIPVTTPARTLLDYGEQVTLGELERAVAEAQVKGLVREHHLHDVIARSPGRHGLANLLAVLADGPRFTRAESERMLLRLLREAGLPIPRTNVRVLRFEADFLWPEQKLIVEVDGFGPHGHRRAFEDDRRRWQNLAAAGYRVVPVTWRQLNDEPIAVAARIAAALATAA